MPNTIAITRSLFLPLAAVAAVVTIGLAMGRDAHPDLGDATSVQPNQVSVSTSPTPIMTPKPTKGPLSVNAAGSAESGNVRDIVPSVNVNSNSEPIEINKLNRVPIKKIDPTVAPARDGKHRPIVNKKKKVRKNICKYR